MAPVALRPAGAASSGATNPSNPSGALGSLAGTDRWTRSGSSQRDNRHLVGMEESSARNRSTNSDFPPRQPEMLRSTGIPAFASAGSRRSMRSSISGFMPARCGNRLCRWCFKELDHLLAHYGGTTFWEIVNRVTSGLLAMGFRFMPSFCAIFLRLQAQGKQWYDHPSQNLGRPRLFHLAGVACRTRELSGEYTYDPARTMRNQFSFHES